MSISGDLGTWWAVGFLGHKVDGKQFRNIKTYKRDCGSNYDSNYQNKNSVVGHRDNEVDRDKSTPEEQSAVSTEGDEFRLVVVVRELAGLEGVESTC